MKTTKGGTMIQRLGLGLALAFMFMASGCAASKYIDAAQQVRPKNPHAACEYLAQALKADPQNQQAIALLKEIGEKIAEDHASRVAELERAGKFADAVAQCDRVLATRALITGLPGNVDIFVNADLRSKLRQKAAEKYLAEGKSHKAAGNAKKAAQSFCLAKGFDPGSGEATALYAESKSAATLRVAVAKFQSASHHGQSISTDLTRRFIDKVVEKKPQFLALSAEGEGSQAQATLVGNIGVNFKDSGWIDKKGYNKGRKSRPSVDEKGNPRLDGQGRQIYEEYTVDCHWVYHERSTSLGLSLGYQVKLADGTIRWASKDVSNSATDRKAWVSDIRGDRDCLPTDVSGLPRDARDPQDFGGLASLIVDGLVDKLAHELYLQQKK
jgi:hypothetical protein